MHAKTYTALLAIAITAGSCKSHENGPVQVPDPRAISGENREWWDIYNVEFKGDKKIRTKVGYLYFKWDNDQPKGTYWVRDRANNDVGFILSNLQGYQIAPPRPPHVKPAAHPLGTSDIDGAIKKLLVVPGTVEREKVYSRGTGGASEATAASRSQ